MTCELVDDAVICYCIRMKPNRIFSITVLTGGPVFFVSRQIQSINTKNCSQLLVHFLVKSKNFSQTS